MVSTRAGQLQPPVGPATGGQASNGGAYVTEPAAPGRARPRSQPPAGYQQDPLPFEQDTVADPEPTLPHAPARPTAAEQEQAERVLWKALQESGGQDAAHTALNAARRAARDRTDTRQRQQREQARQDRETPLPIPAEHQQTLTRIELLRAQRQTLKSRQQDLWTSTRALQTDLDTAPRWARGRRRNLSSSLDSQRAELTELQMSLVHTEHSLDNATALAARQAREQRAAEARRSQPPLADTLATLRPVIDLADPRSVPGSRAAQLTARRAQQALLDLDPRRPTQPPAWEPPPTSPDRDGRGLGR